MTVPHSTPARGSIPTVAKWTVLLAGFGYTGFVTRLFEQEFGWHLAPIGLLMLFGALQLAKWTERRLRA